MLGISRREFLLGGSASLAAVTGSGLITDRAMAADFRLPAASLDYSILEDTVTRGMMGFGDGGPPPVLRLQQGKPFIVDVVNNLDEVTTVHWHGLRVPNADDGVPYLTQYPIETGETFRYKLNSPDAGTYWYHPHCNTLAQMAKGMTGILIVEDDEDPGFDQDLPLNIRDFRLGGDGQFIDLFKPRNAARGGTLGTVSTVNWAMNPTYDLPAGSLVRLRLVVTDVTRVGTYDLVGGEARVIALDSNPVPEPIAPEGLILAPGQRADIALRIPDNGDAPAILYRRSSQGPVAIAAIRGMGSSARRELRELKPLRPNPIPEPNLADAEHIEFTFGWSPDGDAPSPSICGTLGYTFWSINRKPWEGDTPDPVPPLAILKLGRSYILRLRNETPNDHPIHLHGMTFRLLRSNKRSLQPLLTDTALLQSGETMDIGLVADNPGDWVFHCHVIEHQKTGLTGYLRVEE